MQIRLWLVLLSGACNGSDPCTPGTTRCSGERAQVCASNGEWRDVLDCEELRRRYGLPWHCVPFDGGLHACELLPDADSP